MNVLRRASQVALICNVFFLLCVVMRYVPFVKDQVLISIILIMGWLMAFWINVAVNIGVVIRWRRLQGIPRWLLLINVGIGVVQVYFFFLQKLIAG